MSEDSSHSEHDFNQEDGFLATSDSEDEGEEDENTLRCVSRLLKRLRSGDHGNSHSFAESWVEGWVIIFWHPDYTSFGRKRARWS